MITKRTIKDLECQCLEREFELNHCQQKSKEELDELNQACESEMTRAFQQIQQREAVLNKHEDTLHHSDFRIRELMKALEESERSKELINSELNALLNEVSLDYSPTLIIRDLI